MENKDNKNIPVNVMNLTITDFTTGKVFERLGVKDMDKAAKMEAKVQLRDVAKKLGFKEDEFDEVWKYHIESSQEASVKDAHIADDNGFLAILDHKNDGTIAATTENFILILQNDPQLAGKIVYNTFSKRPERIGSLPWRTGKDGGWTDCDDAELRAYIERKYHISSKNKLIDALLITSNENSYHPIISKIESLPAWDGISRIGDIFPKFLGADKSDYTYIVTLNWMLGALSRIYNPGCKYDHVLILVGAQGAGKSTLLRLLALEDSWFDDSIGGLSGKDSAMRLCGKWLIEFQELKALKREKDSESIKAFITTQSDYYRNPYDRRTQDHPRQCVFAGTTNEDSFLTDRTGNRRFLPIEVKGTDPAELFKPESRRFIEQCWAEALAIFREEGMRPSLNLPAEIERMALAKQQKHLEEDPRVSLIQGWLDSTNEQYVAVIDIWRIALGEMGNPSRKDSNEIHRMIKHDITGWREAESKHRTSLSVGPTKCYERIPGPKQLTFNDCM